MIVGTEFDWFTVVADFDDYEILKYGFHTAVKNYPKDARWKGIIDTEFWQKYAGLSDEVCERINKILMKAIITGKWVDKDYLVRAICALGVSKKQAETIAMTELANVANKIREIAYSEWTRVKKFVWVVRRDDKVCDKCKEIANRTRNGVTIDELKEIIKEVGGSGARDWIPHVKCRCTFKRYRKSDVMKWWE